MADDGSPYLPADDDDEREPAPASKHVCKWPEGCDQPATKGRFGRTYCEAHAEQALERQRERKNERRRVGGIGHTSRAGQRKPRTTGSLKAQIKDAVMMTAAVVAIKDYRVYVAVEGTVDQFAEAWSNVAQTSPTARRYIESLLSGGVWIGALGATMVMVVSVAAVTDNLPPGLHPLGHYCLGVAGISASAVPPPGANGAVPAPAAPAEAAWPATPEDVLGGN